MIDILANEEVDKIIKRVDMNQTLLITGRAETGFAANKLGYYDSYLKVVEDYGDGELANAFKVAKEIGVPHVFLINTRKAHDYISLVQVFRQYDFAYIAPIDIRFSDFFYDASRNKSKITYARDYLERASLFNHTTMVMTDRHASLYEDVDHFLDEMKGHVGRFKSTMNSAYKNRNLCFVANNLKSFPYANVVLASMMCAGDMGQYPKAPIGSAVFDIDSFDIGENEIIYFKDNVLTGTTAENLVNFDKNFTPAKMVVVDRIIKYIQRTLDLSHFHGKQYTAYQKVRIEKALEDYLESLKGWIIMDYEIKSVEFFKEIVGVGSIECRFDIWPKGSVEKYTVIIE